MVFQYSWQNPPKVIGIKEGEVHLWCADLNQSLRWIKNLFRILADEEQRRAERFRYEKDRKCFIMRRGILRTILGRYLDVDPDCIQFKYNLYGKPNLADRSKDKQLCFNVSHSHNLSLCIVTLDRQIGVDVEHIRLLKEADQIVSSFFSPSENSFWNELPNEQKNTAFFYNWASKEAYLKARGEGILPGLNKFDVFFDPNNPSSQRGINISGESSDWFLQTFEPRLGYAAAFVVEGDDCKPTFWKWDFCDILGQKI